jgi:CRISPR-associated endonuclease Cas2
MKPYNGQINILQEIKKIKKCIPKDGNIRIIKITEYQWQEMILLVGERNFNEIINNNERYIKI